MESPFKKFMKTIGLFIILALVSFVGFKYHYLKKEGKLQDVWNQSKTKNDVVTEALNGVSIQFPEKGLVFLLGKSGSGKSTLLNVCGGLDEPTEGEIIVKGRSSKDFTQSDFDSYRNTFVGFVFQEYNILDEFSVEDNIALALELQGKPKDKKAIKIIGLCCVAVIIVIGICVAIPSKTLDFRGMVTEIEIVDKDIKNKVVGM